MENIQRKESRVEEHINSHQCEVFLWKFSTIWNFPMVIFTSVKLSSSPMWSFSMEIFNNVKFSYEKVWLMYTFPIEIFPMWSFFKGNIHKSKLFSLEIFTNVIFSQLLLNTLFCCKGIIWARQLSANLYKICTDMYQWIYTPMWSFSTKDILMIKFSYSVLNIYYYKF